MSGSRNFSRITAEDFGQSFANLTQIPMGTIENDVRRVEPLYACDAPADIVDADRTMSLVGRIVNISTSGAKVAVCYPPDGPTTMFLVDVDRRDVYECDVRWRTDEFIGVRFLDVLGSARKRKLFAGDKLAIAKISHAIAQLDQPPQETVQAGPPPHWASGPAVKPPHTAN